VNIITPEIETEAAIYAEGTRFTKQDIIKAYREHLTTSAATLDIQRFCEQELEIDLSGSGTALVTDVSVDRYGLATVRLEWSGPDDHEVYEFDLDSIGTYTNFGGNLHNGWVQIDGQVKVKKGDRVLRRSAKTVEDAIASLKGESLNSKLAVAVFTKRDLSGYYPVIDGDLVLTGEFRYADQPGEWSNYKGEAAIDNDVALAAGWTIDEEGFAEPSEFAKTGISLSADTLCNLSGLSLEDWGLDEDTSVIVFPDRINATTASGLGIPDIAAGNAALEKKVWAAAVEWFKGGDQ
jgi:hypothetical protein